MSEDFNAVSFFEISTDNPIEVERFYTDVFSWSFSAGHGNPYSIVKTPKRGGMLGGFWDNTTDSSPVAQNWAIFCIEVADVEATCAKAVAAGGKVFSPPMGTPGFEGPIYAHLLDPCGNHIGVYSRLPAQ